MAVQTILASLLQRERTGRGERIELPMLDVATYFDFADLFTEPRLRRSPARRRAERASVGHPSDPYRSTAGSWSRPSPHDRSPRRAARSGFPSGPTRSSPSVTRPRSTRVMFDTIEDGTRGLTADDALARFRERRRAQRRRCLSMDEHLVDPQVEHTELYAISVWHGFGRVRTVRYPATFGSWHHLPRDGEAPRLGEHTGSVIEGAVMADLAIVAPAFVELAHRHRVGDGGDGRRRAAAAQPRPPPVLGVGRHDVLRRRSRRCPPRSSAATSSTARSCRSATGTRRRTTAPPSAEPPGRSTTPPANGSGTCSTNTPEPLGYDPAIIPQWAGGPTSAAFAVLRLEPWRLRVPARSSGRTGLPRCSPGRRDERGGSPRSAERPGLPDLREPLVVVAEHAPEHLSVCSPTSAPSSAPAAPRLRRAAGTAARRPRSSSYGVHREPVLELRVVAHASAACSPGRWWCCARRRTSIHSCDRAGAEDVAEDRPGAPCCRGRGRRCVLPGHFSKRSIRPTPSQKFFQNACSDAMNRMCPSDDS